MSDPITIEEVARLAITGLNITTNRIRLVNDEIAIDKTAGIFYYKNTDGAITSFSQANRIDIVRNFISDHLLRNQVVDFTTFFYPVYSNTLEKDINGAFNILLEEVLLNLMSIDKTKKAMFYFDMLNTNDFTVKNQLSTLHYENTSDGHNVFAVQVLQDTITTDHNLENLKIVNLSDIITTTNPVSQIIMKNLFPAMLDEKNYIILGIYMTIIDNPSI